MSILYKSTRGGAALCASEAILHGLAPGGGLFVPEHIPVLDKSFPALSSLSYGEIAYEVMKLFFTDFSEDELKHCIGKAYGLKGVSDDGASGRFDDPAIAPVKEADGYYYLELFHGETIAFKDMALSILPHLMTASAKKK